MPFSPSPSLDERSPLLRLPIEVRLLILNYALPFTSTFDVRFQRSDGERERAEYNLTFVRETSTNGAWKMRKTSPRSDREVGNDVRTTL